MGQFTTAGKNAMLGATGITHAALFNGDPESGGVEITGGSPAYARQAIALTPSGGAITNSTDYTFNVPAGSTVNWVGYFNQVTGGTLLGKDDVTQEVFGAQGTYVLTDQSFTI